MLVDELLRALEDVGSRASGAAGLVAAYCRTAGGDRKEALQEHVDALMTVRRGFNGCRGDCFYVDVVPGCVCVYTCMCGGLFQCIVDGVVEDLFLGKGGKGGGGRNVRGRKCVCARVCMLVCVRMHVRVRVFALLHIGCNFASRVWHV